MGLVWMVGGLDSVGGGEVWLGLLGAFLGGAVVANVNYVG